MSIASRKELVQSLGDRYRRAGRKEKSRILDEFVKVTGYHRKHATRLLNQGYKAPPDGTRKGKRIYDDAVREALIVLWETADRICGKRLKAILPNLVEAMERHGHLSLDAEVRGRLLQVSASTIDRLLAPAREKIGKKRRRRDPSGSVRKRVPVRTFGDWGDVRPGFFEGDFVAHCGGSLAGSFVHSFVITDVATGWTECLPLISRQRELVTEALEVFRKRLPIELKGLNTDNDGAFINEVLIEYCDAAGIAFTRSRAYRKNDQAWVEQKNGAVVRRLVGYGRLTGFSGTQALGVLHRVARLYVNFFQPSFRLREKNRVGAKLTRRFDPPATPCERLLQNDHVSDEIKEDLRHLRRSLDPVKLLKDLRDAQAQVAALTSARTGMVTEVVSQDLQQFLDALPELWKAGEVRPTHRKPPQPVRSWRTRKDPFAEVWPQVLSWLEAEPDVTAKALFLRLMELHPDDFNPGQLRTLQRRVREWRQRIARALIFCGSGLPKGDDRLGESAN
jgi:hypothetical protein